MPEFEALLALLLAAVALAAVARKIGVPYPAFLALGGAILAFLPGTPELSLEPQLALALFVAPVLLDAAYDASPRDLRENWIPLLNLAVVSVGLTTAAVALVVRALVPEIPWAAAIALGAIVSPPDATAATTVLRNVKLPLRIVTILEGESLLNDASALLIYRLALGALAANFFSLGSIAPTLVWAVGGSVVVGLAAAWLVLRSMMKVRDVPTSIILQFISTFGVWILAERIGISGILTMVVYAVAVARRAPELIPARMRIPSYAVWDTAVFVLNVLAFVFIGLQIRPILIGLDPLLRVRYLYIAVAVLLTVIAVRFAWVMTYVFVVRWRIRRFGFHPRRSRVPPSFAGGFIVSWCGMRGIVSLAAALALPHEMAGTAFPFRDLILFVTFSVVVGTLVIQGLTLGRLLNVLDVQDDRVVEREVDAARDRALTAGLATFGGNLSEAARAARHGFTSHLRRVSDGSLDESGVANAEHLELHKRAVAAARQVVLEMRATNEIGDAAFHQLEEELDWMEMGSDR